MIDRKRVRLVQFARKQLGKPYKFGAKLKEAPKAFDCSSFIQYLYKRVGIKLPRTALDQASCGEKVLPKKNNLKIGDLLFFKGGWGHYNPEYPQGIGHVGVFVGNGKVISARYKQKSDGSDDGFVIEEEVESFINRPDFVVARRILG